MKILVVEDDNSLREVISRSLERERYVVETAENYREALFKLEDYDYDCVLLDVMLPDGNGLDLLKKMQEIHKTDSVIVISAKDSLDDKVLGLELGADDYLSKPFHLAELHARIRSVLRRKHQQGYVSVDLGNVRLFPQEFTVQIDGKNLKLGRKEYDILYYFMNRPNRLVNKETLVEAVWGDHIDQSDNFDFIYAQMKNIRRKLKEAGATLEIKSVYGFGYKLMVD